MTNKLISRVFLCAICEVVGQGGACGYECGGDDRVDSGGGDNCQDARRGGYEGGGNSGGGGNGIVSGTGCASISGSGGDGTGSEKRREITKEGKNIYVSFKNGNNGQRTMTQNIFNNKTNNGKMKVKYEIQMINNRTHNSLNREQVKYIFVKKKEKR